MKCIKCGKDMERAVDAIPGEYGGEKVTVRTKLMRCKGCGYKTVHASQIDAYAAAVADAYRKKHGRLTSAQIREARRRMKLSQDQFAKHLGVGIASVKRWETGQVQDPAAS